MLSVKNLKKRYKDTVAVDGVSFNVNENETVVLLGPNGSGKTTTLKSIVGLIIPDEGEIYINGVNVLSEPKRARSYLSFLPQRISLYESLKVIEILEFFRKLRGLPVKRVEYVIEMLDLKDLLGKYANELSGGNVQRLGIALAIMPEVPILILDEPTLSLDPEGVMRFKSLLSQLKKDGKTILFTTHLLNEVDELADKVGILVNGRLITFESASELKKKLKFESKVYLVVKNMDDGFVKLAYDSGAIEVSRNGTSMIIKAESNKILDVIFNLYKSGAQIENFQTSSQSFEAIYQKLMEEHEPKN
ncbi:ABC-2 type transport system ATP-binding protein [Candidatus Kryptobacter tengchongensis]|uniref:ABC-2 type transport system ATP-binding protein n=1 Tax=Kryptobacter tengchongensis TaxID=1643429 RepID=A0A656D8L0_KRYT1|nr:ABC transporter ATP-binding protein [Candidatus Kryptobacter tengchongensis]CUT00531.1 ABC-2 type transport system ATP-binding protein [Candidatus Kryptobacter tengchongensis]CUT03277.1 ABC-2 type transport system ATP-binding protein [Candidatus Kryptobacter tengchongensis]CUU07926.1 ABC-2 type transport system ATP-binding protein [Candidatus Kryptobacter tengchongensis]